MTAKKMFRMSLLMCIALLVSASSAFGDVSVFVDVSPLSPAYVKFMEEQGASSTAERTLSDKEDEADDLGTGYEPSPLYWEHLRNKAWDLTDGREITSAGSANSAYSTYSSYSAYPTDAYATPLSEDPVLEKQYDNRSSLPAVRNQNSFGNCWVYAALGATEANLIKQGYVSNSVDLSEWYLTYYGHNNWYGDMAPFYSGYTYYLAGGNDWKAVALLARGTGSVLSYYSPDISYASQAYAPLISSRDYKLIGAYYLGAPSSSSSYDREVQLTGKRIEMIKRAIYKYGGVSVGFYSASMKKSNAGYNSATGAYYSGKTLSEVSTDHAVVLVGWDDDYSVDNFSTGFKPSSNGAWIARNSWGSSWGNFNGYFYISYEEATLCDGVVYETVPAPANEKIYQYDPLGCTGWATATAYGVDSDDSDGVYFANLFYADVDDKINSVAFYVPDIGIKYEVYFYTDCENSPVGGEEADIVLEPENLIPGYNTVSLPEGKAVEVKAGTKFSVVVKATKNDDADDNTFNYPIPLEFRYTTSYRDVSANAGEGWVSTDGKNFEDIISVGVRGGDSSINTSICLKAFGEAGETVKRVSTVSSGDSGGGSGCNMGVSALALLMLAPIALYARRRKS